MRPRLVIVLALLCSLARPAHAQSVTVTPSPVPEASAWDLFRGSSKVSGPHPSVQSCAQALPPDVLDRKQSGNYFCKASVALRGTYVEPKPPVVVVVPPKPAPDTRTMACPAGSTGSWTQSRGYYSVQAPTYWAPGSWLPLVAPLGACKSVTVTPPPVVVPPPVVQPPVTPPAVSELPTINEALIPVNGAAPSFDRRITTTGEMPYRDPDGMGAFRTVCQWSHFGRYDPLVFPGLLVSGHEHVFWGNADTRGNSTPESIRTSGGSTCRGGIVNRSAYWVPAMVDTSTGRVIAPAPDIDVYYKTGYGLFGQDAQVTPFPQGFRMIAGDSKSRTLQGQVGHFDCNGAISTGIPANCSSGVLMHIIEFPHCWDGVNLDSPDHRSHVIYPSGGACPRTHPVHLPQVSYRVKYAATGTATWRLSSDLSGTPAGSSSHGDWMHGWEQEVMNTFVSRVIRQGQSGGSHILGDGRVIY